MHTCPKGELMVVVYARLIISYAHLESDAFTHYMVGHYVVIGFQIFPRGVGAGWQGGHVLTRFFA